MVAIAYNVEALAKKRYSMLQSSANAQQPIKD